MSGMSVAFNALSLHETCTAVFVAVSAILGCGFSSIRTLGKITWIAWIGVICILSASGLMHYAAPVAYVGSESNSLA